MFSYILYKVLYFVTDKDKMTKSFKVFACWVILYDLLSSADLLFSKLTFHFEYHQSV